MTKQEKVEASALSVLDDTNLPALFGSDSVIPMIERIETEVRSFAPDLSTTKSRKEIASLAYRVARSKTALDDAGKGLTEEARKQIEAVNAERKVIRDRLDALRDEVRKPLDEWEATEEARKAAHREALIALNGDRTDWSMPSADIQEILTEIEATKIGEAWEEFAGMAEEAKAAAIKKIKADLTAAKGREEQATELARLRAEAEEREAQAAKLEAERIAKEKAEEAEREKARKAEEAEREKARKAEERERKKEEDARRAKEREIEAQNERAEVAIDYIKGIGNGMIGGIDQPLGILIYELEEKLEIDETLGLHQAAVEALRDTVLGQLRRQLENTEVKPEPVEADSEDDLALAIEVVCEASDLDWPIIVGVLQGVTEWASEQAELAGKKAAEMQEMADDDRAHAQAEKQAGM